MVRPETKHTSHICRVEQPVSRSESTEKGKKMYSYQILGGINALLQCVLPAADRTPNPKPRGEPRDAAAHVPTQFSPNGPVLARTEVRNPNCTNGASVGMSDLGAVMSYSLLIIPALSYELT